MASSPGSSTTCDPPVVSWGYNWDIISGHMRSEVVFYVDYGMSNGMEAARHRLEKHFSGMKTAVRRIGMNPDA